MDHPRTSSPAEKSAPSPTASMTPVNSFPRVCGKFAGIHRCVAPPRNRQSNDCTPAALTRTRTCPGPGTGSGTSLGWRTSGPPYSSKTIAVAMAALFRRCEDGDEALRRYRTVSQRRFCMVDLDSSLIPSHVQRDDRRRADHPSPAANTTRISRPGIGARPHPSSLHPTMH